MSIHRSHKTADDLPERCDVPSAGKTLGIIGGMGPLATADLFYKIILNTEAESDTGHIRIVIDNNPKIPDRTKAILEGSDAPYPYILDMAQRLVRMGADLLLLPCNTSHVYYERLSDAVGTPIVNMIEETAKQVSAMGIRRAGLLATTGTLYARLYERALERHHVDAVLPSSGGQQTIMSLIYDGVKAGASAFDTTGVCQTLHDMTQQGAETFILGCTEIPIAFQQYRIPFPSVDPSEVLAKAAIVMAGYPLKQASPSC